jgi:hypothetical protein
MMRLHRTPDAGEAASRAGARASRPSGSREVRPSAPGPAAGLGDGVKARALKTFPGDFSSAAYQDQTDGEHFYKTKFGRGEMPKYEGKMSDNDIWNMVNYMRTFKK